MKNFTAVAVLHLVLSASPETDDIDCNCCVAAGAESALDKEGQQNTREEDDSQAEEEEQGSPARGAAQEEEAPGDSGYGAADQQEGCSNTCQGHSAIGEQNSSKLQIANL